MIASSMVHGVELARALNFRHHTILNAMIWVNQPLNEITFNSQGASAAQLPGLQKPDRET